MHRAGRTGRAGKQGTVFTLYHNKNLQAINEFKKSHDKNVPLDVRNSAYSLINKEDFQHLRKTSKPIDKSVKKKKEVAKARRIKPHKTVRFRQKVKIKRRNND